MNYQNVLWSWKLSSTYSRTFPFHLCELLSGVIVSQYAFRRLKFAVHWSLFSCLSILSSKTAPQSTTWKKGHNWRTFVKNVATFGERFLVFVHDGFQLTNSCSMKLDCRANCLISLQQFHVPVYGTCRDVTLMHRKAVINWSVVV